MMMLTEEHLAMIVDAAQQQRLARAEAYRLAKRAGAPRWRARLTERRWSGPAAADPGPQR